MRVIVLNRFPRVSLLHGYSLSFFYSFALSESRKMVAFEVFSSELSLLRSIQRSRGSFRFWPRGEAVCCPASRSDVRDRPDGYVKASARLISFTPGFRKSRKFRRTIAVPNKILHALYPKAWVIRDMFESIFDVHVSVVHSE